MLNIENDIFSVEYHKCVRSVGTDTSELDRVLDGIDDIGGLAASINLQSSEWVKTVQGLVEKYCADRMR